MCIFSPMCAFFLSCPSDRQCFNLKGLTGKMISWLHLDFLLSIVSSACGLNEPCESLRCGQRAETNGPPPPSLLYLSLPLSVSLPLALSLPSTHLSICVFWRAPSLCARQSSPRYLRCSPCGRALSRDDAKLSTVQHLNLRVKLKRSLCLSLSLSICLFVSLWHDGFIGNRQKLDSVKRLVDLWEWKEQKGVVRKVLFGWNHTTRGNAQRWVRASPTRKLSCWTVMISCWVWVKGVARFH